MNTVLYFSANGAVYETRAYSTSDIDQLIQDQGLQCFSSADKQFDFWFSPSAAGCQRRTNRQATEMLMATTSFTARTVPLLRGAVVVATHDADGDLDGLSWQQLGLLAEKNSAVTAREERVLNRRIYRDAHRERPAVARPAAARTSTQRTPARRSAVKV